MFFEKIEEAPEDPIFGLTSAFMRDQRSHKVNLGVGVFRNADLKEIVLNTVRKAELRLAAANLGKGYLPIDGDPEFLRLSRKLVFGEKLASDDSLGWYSAQAVGGTGALRVAAEFISKFMENKTIFIPDPTWPNHKQVFSAAGLKVATYPYYDHNHRSFDFGKMCEGIKAMPSGSTILLHGCCHNPTGFDPKMSQWEEIAILLKKQRVFPLFDFAYQGFGRELDQDAQAIRYFAREGHEMFVANSYSKNFGLYGERTGTLFALTGDRQSAQHIGSQFKILIRSNYSNPSTHGARIVSEILKTPELTREWETEVAGMRGRVMEMRRALASGLLSRGKADFSFMDSQVGLFSFCGLEKEQVTRLMADYAIYMPGNGRINVTGLSLKNLDYVIDAILAVV